MNNKEINAALAALEQSAFLLEEEYMENGGEVTEVTMAHEEQIEYLKSLLENEGIDSLGRWLKSKEDLIKTLKAERDAIARQIKKTEEGIDYIKSQLYVVINAIGKEKVKGTLYSFTPVMSVKTEVDKDVLKEKYMDIANEAFRSVLPPWVTFTLGASVKAVPEDAEFLPLEFRTLETPSCRFTKPRAKKED